MRGFSGCIVCSIEAWKRAISAQIVVSLQPWQSLQSSEITSDYIRLSNWRCRSRTDANFLSNCKSGSPDQSPLTISWCPVVQSHVYADTEGAAQIIPDTQRLSVSLRTTILVTIETSIGDHGARTRSWQTRRRAQWLSVVIAMSTHLKSYLDLVEACDKWTQSLHISIDEKV